MLAKISFGTPGGRLPLTTIKSARSCSLIVFNISFHSCLFNKVQDETRLFKPDPAIKAGFETAFPGVVIMKISSKK